MPTLLTIIIVIATEPTTIPTIAPVDKPLKKIIICSHSFLNIDKALSQVHCVIQTLYYTETQVVLFLVMKNSRGIAQGEPEYCNVF